MKSSLSVRNATLVVWLGLVGCHASEHVAEKPKLAVTSPVRQSTELTRVYVGAVRAIQHIELRALERGYLQGIFVDEGQRVERGQRMFQLAPMIAQAEVQKAEAEVERTRIELANTRLLADKNVVSPNELALAEAAFSRAKAELALATTHRGFTEIRAPFTGLMGRFHARLGSLIDEGDLLTTLSDNSTVWVYFNVSEAEYLSFARAGGTQDRPQVRFELADGQPFSAPGTLETIGSEFDRETGTIAFRAAFPNPDGLLRHGETGRVILPVPLPDALVLPQKATFDVLDKKFVYVVDKAGAVHARPITVSAELPQVYVVASGVGVEDRVLLDGLRKVREGMIIEPEYRSPRDVLATLEVPAE